MISIPALAGDCAERWLPVVGYEGRYEVSDQGRVRSLITGKIRAQHTRSHGYLCVSISRLPAGVYVAKTVHSMVAEAFIGPRPAGFVCDHANRNRRDNRRVNLRYVNKRQNGANANRQRGASGLIGVRRAPWAKQGRWQAYISYENKQKYVGLFATKEEAAIARDKAAIELLGECAILNFPITDV